jgi:hypothetical protein
MADVLVWGAQINIGPTALTYIPTTTAAKYSLPIDHDPITFDPLGVLIEEQRVNLLTYSEQFDNAAWGKTDTTITANNTAAPDGTTTADLITDGSAGTSALVNASAATVTVASPITFSVFAKRGNSDWFFVQLAGSGTERIRGWFNLATGAVGSATVVAPATSASISIIPVANGFYRCILTGTLNGAGTTAQVLMTGMDGDASLTRVNDATRYLWGAQLE